MNAGPWTFFFTSVFFVVAASRIPPRNPLLRDSLLSVKMKTTPFRNEVVCDQLSL